MKCLKWTLTLAMFLLLTGCGGAGVNWFPDDDPSSTDPPSTRPAAPSVTATGGDQKVILNWSAVPGATSYNVYWSTTSGVTTSSTNKLSGSGTTQAVTSLTNNTKYYFIVTAVNSAGESAPSTEADAIPTQGAEGTIKPTTAEMFYARTDHTATLLGNGQVLIVGGRDASFTALATAELYDPQKGTYTPIAFQLAKARYSHRAAKVTFADSNGTPQERVLIVGGLDDNSDPVATAELYNPTDQSFTPVGSLNTPRSNFAVSELGTTVLITGGTDASYSTLSSAELFDSATNKFTTLASAMQTPRTQHTATVLPNGRVLIAGGADVLGNTLASAEIYYPSTKAFTTIGSTMSTPRKEHVAVLMSGTNQVLLVTGVNGNSPVAAAELYDPATNRFTPTGALATPRVSATATWNGKQVLVAGGSDGSAAVYDTVELYSPATGLFSALPAPTVMASPRSGHAAVLTGQTTGAVLITGGMDGNGTVLSSSDLFQ